MSRVAPLADLGQAVTRLRGMAAGPRALTGDDRQAVLLVVAEFDRLREIEAVLRRYMTARGPSIIEDGRALRALLAAGEEG